MLKRLFFYFIGFVVLASLAYYGFSQWQASREKVNLWAIVPESAAIVVETNNHEALAAHLTKTGLWQSMEALPVVQDFQEGISLLDTIAPGKQRLSRFLDKKNILTSAHITAEKELSFVFYVPVNSVGEHRFLRTLTENLVKHPDFEQASRNYNNVLVTDVTYKPLDLHYTYFTYHNNIILSTSAGLIEEVINKASQENPISIASDFKSANYLNQADVYANVFVNNHKVPELLNLFLNDDIMPQVRYLSSLCRNGMLQLKLQEDKIFLNGFSNPDLAKTSLHTNLSAVKPKAIRVKDYLPVRTAVLFHFGVQQVTRIKQYQSSVKFPLTPYDATIDSLATTIRQELALAYLESASIRTSPEKVVYARTTNKARASKLLSQLTAQAKILSKSTLHSSTYGGFTIQQLAVPDLPGRMFGGLFTGFEESYVVALDDYLLFTDELSTARALIDDVLAEKVWSKSATQQVFQEQTLQEANFSFFLNTVNAWNILSRYTSEDERESLLQSSSFIRRFNHVSLQYARVEGQYYTSLVLWKPERNSGAAQRNFTVAFSVPFGSRLISKPFAVRNIVDRSREIIVQDSVFALHNITADGRRTWSDTLSSSVRGNIVQLPLGPESRLRYLFATTNRIHALDGQGRSIENFPFNLTDTVALQRLTVIDYGRSGNYNLLADDELGNLHMYDIRGNGIQGWEPRRLDYKLAAAPQHLHVGNRDLILVLLENGYVYALNRNGETYQGFPFSLKSPVTAGAVATKVGADLRRTELATVTRYGEVVTFNLQGRVLSRQKLPRPSKNAMFELVQDENNSAGSYVFVRQELGKVAIFDPERKLLFEKRFVTSAPKLVQFFNFGGGQLIYAITETGPQETYLYDASGKLIGGAPLESSQSVTIYHNEAENTYSLYKVYRKELQKVNFKLQR